MTERVYWTASCYTHADGCPTRVEFKREDEDVWIRFVTANVCTRWHLLSASDATNIIGILQR